MIAEYDSNGNELKSYGYKPDSTWTTDPLWLKQGGQYYFYQNDHLGTPQKLVAQNGAVVWSVTYEAFGKAYMETETVVNNLRLPGQYYDTETGLHYNFQRYYEPGSGRYVGVDPIGLSGGFNLFAYAMNNPGNVIDPIGLFVHPQHIIPPDEAVDLVTQVMTTPLLYNLKEDGIFNRLDYAGNMAFSPGGWKDPQGNRNPHWYNRFVFTCRYGWLDLGHYFQSAYFAYGIASGIGQNTWLLDPFLYQVGEMTQWVRIWEMQSATYQSNYTPEDLPSNWLGWQWGRGVAFRKRAMPFVPMDFAVEFETMLKQSGAVVFTRGDEVNQYLKADVVRWWNHGYYVEPPEIYKEMDGAIYTGKRDPWPFVKYTSKAYWKYCCSCPPTQLDNPTWEEPASSSCGDWPVSPWTGYAGKSQQ